jgi:hypothetical protein
MRRRCWYLCKTSNVVLTLRGILQVVLVALRADAYHQPWSYLLHHISPAQATVRQLQGHCFRKLVLGTNMLLDAFWNEWTTTSG